MSDNIHVLQFIFAGNQSAVQLNFRGGQTADAAYKSVVDRIPDGEEFVLHGVIQITDDFGGRAIINLGAVIAVCAKTLSGELEAQCEIALAQTRAQSMAQRKAQTDPMLKLANSAPPFSTPRQ